MRLILTIAKWELKRLMLRFGGRLRYVILATVLLAFGASYLVYHSGIVSGKELYTVGVSTDAPEIFDKQFRVIKVDAERGVSMLNQHTLDVYIDGNLVVSRNDERSAYVRDSLLKYLADQELFRIAEQYDSSRAFPLRVEIVPLERKQQDSTAGNGLTSAPDIGTDDAALVVKSQTTPGDISRYELQEPTITDIKVKEQLESFEDKGFQKLKDTLLSDQDVIIPSLSPPVLPMARVILVFSFILPVLLVAVFFASSFTEERVNRRLVVLLSTPVSSFQVITGKMLPYLVYSLVVITLLTLLMGGNILLSLAIYTPVILLIFSAYMIVALMYRTFKDLTLFSVLVVSAIMTYLVIPALLTGVSNLSYISPLTLAVEMYQGDTFGLREYFLATTPLYLIFVQTIFIGTRIFNEEYLMGFKPLHTKIAEAVNLAVNKNHVNISAFLSNFFLLPPVFIAQLILIILVQNVPAPASLWILVIISAVTEELAKSAVVFVLLKSKKIKTRPEVLRLSALSGAGFFTGEKLLLLLSLAVLADSDYISAVFSGGLWIFPFFLHIAATSVVGLITRRLGTRYYLLAVIIGSLIHAAYNLFFLGVFA